MDLSQARWRRRLTAGALALAAMAAPAGGLAASGTPRLVGADVLQDWHAEKARGGPTFAGSPAWRAHVEFLERELRARGATGLQRRPLRYGRWYTADDPGEAAWTLAVDGDPVPVASYWAYSGGTGDDGVTAPLIRYEPGLAPDALRGRIVVFEIPPLPDPLPPVFRPPAQAFLTPDLLGVDRQAVTEHWYQVNYATRFGRLGDKLVRGGAAGGLVVFDMSAGRAAGLYTFPLLAPGELGIPGLYLDRRAGERVLDAARDGRRATLRLRARREDAEAWFLTGYLPGRRYGAPDDELLLWVTHTDGPNLTQENGGLAMLAMIDYLAQRPAAERERSILFVLDPQHYMPGRHLVDWYGEHPDVMARVVASIGIEQLGQRAWAERAGRYEPTAEAEPAVLFVQDNPRLVQWAIDAVTRHGLPRTEIRVPARTGHGRWAGLGEIAVQRGLPGYGFSTDMSAYWSTVPGIESFDAELCRRQIAVLLDLSEALLAADRAAIQPAAER